MKIYKIAQEEPSESEEISSETFEWKDNRDEMFTFLTRNFDIDLAKRIIKTNPRNITNVGLSGLKSWVPRSKTSVGLIKIDWDRIDAEEGNYDLSFPVIIASIEGGHFPIDGWHRIAKAIEQGVESLPSVMLTPEETEQILL